MSWVMKLSGEPLATFFMCSCILFALKLFFFLNRIKHIIIHKLFCCSWWRLRWRTYVYEVGRSRQMCGYIFSRHSPNWWVVKKFHSPSQKTTGPIHVYIHIEIVRRGKTSRSWRVGLYFYSPILNSTRIWRVG
jgi:hypothetical protein